MDFRFELESRGLWHMKRLRLFNMRDMQFKMGSLGFMNLGFFGLFKPSWFKTHELFAVF